MQEAQAANWEPLLTFPQTVADSGVPGQQGVFAAEAQHQRVGQTQDGQRVGDAVVAGPGLHAADPLSEQSHRWRTVSGHELNK